MSKQATVTVSVDSNRVRLAINPERFVAVKLTPDVAYKLAAELMRAAAQIRKEKE